MCGIIGLMADSKHPSAGENGAHPDETPERERETGVSGLPRAKLFYMASGYGFGQEAAVDERERGVSLTP